MKIVETSEFQKDWKACLSAHERHALDLLLADDPSVGKPLAGSPGIMTLEYAGATIYFGVAPDLSELFLLGIHRSDEAQPEPTKAERSKLRRLLDAMVAGGVISGAKSAGKWLWERVREWLEGGG